MLSFVRGFVDVNGEYGMLDLVWKNIGTLLSGPIFNSNKPPEDYLRLVPGS